MAGRLEGQTALITGGSRGLGFAIAQAFASEGADVMIAATNAETLGQSADRLRANGRRVETAALDVASRQACFDVVDRAIETFGQLDVLVNSASVYIPKPVTGYSPEEFDRTLQVNLYGVFHLTQAVLPHMTGRRHGKIVNISSSAGRWASKNQAAYNVAKHGVVGLTRCVALETAAHGISVNTICPGFFETDLLDQFVRQHSELNDVTPDVMRAQMLGRVPMGRFLDPRECAHLAVYLASRESDGMTGQSIQLDGGMLFV